MFSAIIGLAATNYFLSLFPAHVEAPIALEMFKSLLEVDGFVIGFSSIVMSQQIQSAKQQARNVTLVLFFSVYLLLLASILASIQGMSSLSLAPSYPGIEPVAFRSPIYFILAGLMTLGFGVWYVKVE